MMTLIYSMQLPIKTCEPLVNFAVGVNSRSIHNTSIKGMFHENQILCEVEEARKKDYS
jgi:hypothetical protein